VERLRGTGVSTGVAIGTALVAVQRTQVIRYQLAPERVADELAALERARQRSREQLQQVRRRLAALRGRELAAIFDAQILLLDDPMLATRASALVRDERVNAEWAVQHAFDEVAALLNDPAEPALGERTGDLRDLAQRLRANLRTEQRGRSGPFEQLDGPCVVVADELTPSAVAQLDWTRIGGFATDIGSRTHHTAIMARSLGVPAVVGLGDASLRVPAGATVIIDADSGEIVVDPTPAVQREAEARLRLSRARSLVVARAPEGPLTTADGLRITLEANLDRPEEIPGALAAGAEGIGLYRSEVLLAGSRPERAGEAHQYAIYRRLLEDMRGRPVTIRTFDVDERPPGRDLGGGSLQAPWLGEPDTRDGHAGLRGIRFALATPTIFRTQLRALLRAASHGWLRIVFPFVSGVEEMRAARRLVDDVRQELAGAGQEAPPVLLGAMIEVPSAALMAAALACTADFFAIGTNDLIQYTLAVDRADERVSAHYQPLHPAILRLIRHVRRSAAREGIPVSVCGEMASDPVLLPLLIGCGLRTFSMTPAAIAAARAVVGRTDSRALARVAGHAVRFGTTEEVERYLARLEVSAVAADPV